MNFKQINANVILINSTISLILFGFIQFFEVFYC